VLYYHYLSVSLFPCPSQSSIVSKRLNLPSTDMLRKAMHEKIWGALRRLNLFICNFERITQLLHRESKTLTQSFCHNFGVGGPIFIILSLLHSEINYRRRWNKICHLASTVLPHYRAKLECSTVQLLFVQGAQ